MFSNTQFHNLVELHNLQMKNSSYGQFLDKYVKRKCYLRIAIVTTLLSYSS